MSRIEDDARSDTGSKQDDDDTQAVPPDAPVETPEADPRTEGAPGPAHPQEPDTPDRSDR
jgi:hypothetical protein